MTSPKNHQQTVAFFENHHRFGLDKEQVIFFPQGTLPFLDTQGNLFLEERHLIAEGPDGNGLSLKHFYDSGIWANWHRRGIRYLNFIVIDNPLADPFDAELVGHLFRRKSDVAVKCAFRKNAHEKVGVLALAQDKVCVVEYSELPDHLKEAASSDGSLQFPCANLSLFCFTMDFVKRVAADLPTPPYHAAFKSTHCLAIEGNQRLTKKTSAWKFESFIFDFLPYASHPTALLYPRNECFAPLKNENGDNSVSVVRDALLERDRKQFSLVSGLPCTTFPLELSQEFYYPTPELFQRWRGRTAPPGYIEPLSKF